MDDKLVHGGPVERRLTLAVNIAMLVILTWVGWQLAHSRLSSKGPSGPEPPTAPLPAEPVALDGASLLGSANARVVLLGFSDFKCPFCRRFATDIMPALKKQFIDTGQVRLAFRQFPLPIHPGARDAAAATLCAGEQGQFWTMHDALFTKSQDWTATTLAAEADAMHLTSATFQNCFNGQAVGQQVEKDIAAGKALGVTGTPTFFVGRTLQDGRIKLTARIAGARPVANFEEAFQKALSDGTR